MSDDDDDHEPSCHFKWEIRQPFLPWHELQATFYGGSPSVTRWKVTMKPLVKRELCCPFVLTLELDPTFAEQDEIVASRVQVEVLYKGKRVNYLDIYNVWFGPRTSRGHSFLSEVYRHTPQKQDLLAITIKLHLIGAASVKQYPDINERNDGDPTLLSKDMFKLVINPIYSNMKMRSADGYIFDVHSYIIRARWSNFFTLIPFSAGPEVPIETNIWGVLLWDILTYMYSGILNFGLAHWANPSCTSRLFHVIHLYKLYHLYKVLVKDDLKQKRVTARNELTASCDFQLRNVLGTPRDSSQSWLLNPNTRWEFLFTIRVQSTHGPWLSYSLQSRSEFLVYAHVHLKFRRTVVVTRGTHSRSSHFPISIQFRDYTIRPTQVADSGPVLHLACPETFTDFGPVDRYGQRTAVTYIVCCFLKFSDGGTIDVIKSTDNMFQNDLERFNLLGDHFLELRRNPLQSDLRLVSSDDLEPADSHEIHKAIFAARVGHWWELLQDVEAADEMPDEATSVWGSEALKFALDYIYTSRVFDIPHESILDQILHYADRSKCSSLYDLVYRIRNMPYYDIYA